MKMLFVMMLVALGPAAQAVDEVYRWVDKDGVVHYGAQPPNKDARPAALPAIQTYSNRNAGKALPLAPLDASTTPAAGTVIKEVRIVSPVQDEIFRDPTDGVNVSIAVLPALPNGAGVVFYLDGAAKNAKPIAGTSMTFGSVERGEHRVTAAVVDATGRELARAAPVTFHSKPPSALH